MQDNSKISELLREFRAHESDTGSSMCQIILLTQRIQSVSKEHLSLHKKDHPAKRSVVRWVAQRRRHQRYLAKKFKRDERYLALLSALGLRS